MTGKTHEVSGDSKSKLVTSSATKMNRSVCSVNDDESFMVQSKWSASQIHVASDAPLCRTCEQIDTVFFNIECHGCRQVLSNSDTSISQIFAIMRQWVPQTQHCIEILVSEILRRGANVNDKDGLTDMTLLHYACKSGSNGVGDSNTALATVHMLIENGADLAMRCRWTDMAAIHYAVYFDVSQVVDYILTITQQKFVDERCRDFDGGTPLHIAVTNLCIDSVRVLLNHGANILLKDDLDRTPLDCLPESVDSYALPKSSAAELVAELRSILEKALLDCIPEEDTNFHGPVTGKVVLQALGLALGEKIVINGTKIGTLRYCGATQFASGIWAGIEFDEAEGKNDGSVTGVTYFRCKPNHGIFAPISRIAKIDSPYSRASKFFATQMSKNINYPLVDVSQATPKVDTGLSSFKSKQMNILDVCVGDRVTLTDKRRGYIRFVGETRFASGTWYGIELDRPQGKNDGSVNHVRYFTCKRDHGVFAMASRIMKIIKPHEEEDEVSSEISMSVSSADGNDLCKSPQAHRRMKPRFSTKMAVNQSNSLINDSRTWLRIGTNVFVNNEIGVVRYIGPVDFSDGTWLGIELRTPTGKNDGSVKGRRYFTCKPGHGLVVRPKKVSVRGINGAKLLPDS